MTFFVSPFSFAPLACQSLLENRSVENPSKWRKNLTFYRVYPTKYSVNTLSEEFVSDLSR